AREAADDHQRVVEVVGNSAGEMTDGLHLLRLPILLLERALLGDILCDADVFPHVAVLARDRKPSVPDASNLAVGTQNPVFVAERLGRRLRLEPLRDAIEVLGMYGVEQGSRILVQTL